MEGDFSRGHRPDAKRGRSYRRILARQGAALLDSDLHALMDASDRIDRQNLTHVACEAGSTDLGFFVTAGRLLALFDPVLGQVPVLAGGATAARDYSKKYLDRLPGLRIDGGAGTVTVPLRTPLAAATVCRVWLRADQPVATTVGETVVNIPASADYAPFPVTLNDAQVVFASSAQPFWVALIETEVTSPATEARFHWAAGGFQLGGIIAQPAAAQWPDLAGPAGAALLAASAGAAATRWAAYLELSERVVTAIEDPGLREQALGSDRETTSRSEVMAQVKLAPVTGLPTLAAVRAAFRTMIEPTGRVTFGTSAGAAAANPCDLPVPGGYGGPENRLYRLAVHELVTAGPNPLTRFKWSRDNAGEVWACSLMPDQPPGALVTHVRLAATALVRAGDLVELTSDTIERGDAAAAGLAAAGLSRPRRSQGRLFRLEGGDIVAGSFREFRLLDPLTETPVAPFDASPFGTIGLKLRRWSGLVERTGNGAVTLTLEHGLVADVTGVFEPGDWWQAEARVLGTQANGPVVTRAHGPERLFAPLALFERGAVNTPLILRAWLDTRSRKLCEQEADFTSYDGVRVGTASDTVQEALDELFLRLSDGCGEIAVPPNASVQSVIDTIPAGGNARICLNAGTRNLTATIVVADKGDLIVGGIGPGTLLRSTIRRVIRFERCRSVDLRDFAVEALVGDDGPLIDFVDCGEVRLDQIRVTAAGGAVPGSSAIRQRSSVARPTRSFAMRRCRLSLGMYDTGVTAADPGHAEIEENEITVRPEPLNFLNMLQAGGEMLNAVGTLLLDRYTFHVGDGGFDFVGSPVLDIPVPGPETVARGAIVAANGMWGSQTLSFTTHATLDSHPWDRLMTDNQPPQGNQEPTGSMSGFLVNFRRQLALRAFGLGGNATIPADLNGNFNTVRSGLTGSNPTIHGRTGIVVAMSRGPVRSLALDQPVAQLLLGAAGQTARVRGNRISGFVQGVRVAASSGAARTSYMFAQSVDVQENEIALRLPWQARQRGGIWIGNTLSLRVNGNRIFDPLYRPMSESEPPLGFDADGIRLWGWYGPLVEARGNFVHGTSVGIRWNPLGVAEPRWGRPDVFARGFADNAYSGMGKPTLPAVIP